MFTLIATILVLVIVVLVLINVQRGIRINALQSDLSAWIAYADHCEDTISYQTQRINKLIDRCNALSFDLKIARNEVQNLGSSDNPVYVSDMFNDPNLFGSLTEEFDPSGNRRVIARPNGNHKYVPTLADGMITYTVKPEETVKSEEPKTQKSNGTKSKTQKSTTKVESKLTPEETAFYDLVDLIMADRKVKKLPTDQFEWLKSKYPLWLKSPADQAEYKRRFDNRFPA